MQKLLLKNYLKAFNNHDIKSLKKLFDSNIDLKDWEIEAKGQTSVLQHNKKIFINFPDIKAKVIKSYFLEKIIFCELEIFLSKVDKIYVLDILELNDINKIKKIRAFKG